MRGTTSVEDIITDSVAEPERLDPEWIPKCIRDEANGPLYAHAGIKAAADAVLKVRLILLGANVVSFGQGLGWCQAQWCQAQRWFSQPSLSCVSAEE